MLSSLRRWTKTACVSLVLMLATAGGAGALSEVWIGGQNGDVVSRYDHGGGLLGTFALGGGGYPTDSMTSVGSEVWIGGSNTILRYSNSGNLLGTFTNSAGVASAMTFVPEPSTALLVSLGLIGLGVRRRS